jgi:hypothetical protein
LATIDGKTMRKTPSGSSLRAGIAKADITTSDPGIKINDPLYAKVLVLDDGKTRLAIIAMDAVAIGGIGDISDDFLPVLRQRIEEELSLKKENVLVNASHTHPPGRLLCDEPELVDRVFGAVRRACESMTEVKAGWGIGYEDRIMMNRTLRLKDGRHWTIRHANPCPPDDEVAGVGPVDPDIGILRIDRVDGRPLAVVYNFACHPYLGVPGGGITADYPGFASRVIEESLGHGALALFLQGAGGDITQVLYKDVHRPRDGEPQGMLLGLSTLEAWREIETRTDAALSVVSESVDLPRRTDIPMRIARLRQEQEKLLKSLRFTSLNFRTFLPLYLKHLMNPEYPLDDAYRYLHGREELTEIDEQNRRNLAKYLSNIQAMEKLAGIEDQIATLQRHQAINEAAGEETITAEVLGIRIGEFVLVSAPIEVLVEVGLNVKQASPYEHTFMAAFSNGYMHYGPPAAYYDLGGYEVTECFLAPEWQRLYETTAQEVIRRL